MTDVRRLPGGAPVASEYLVQTDGTTIGGDGTSQRPLHSIEGGGEGPSTYSAIAKDGNGAVGKFMALEAYAAGFPYVSGDKTVKLNNAASLNVGSAGIALSAAADGAPIKVAFSGPVTGTHAEWDAVTGGSGGLTIGHVYYVSQTVAGHLSAIPSAVSGDINVPVGIAISDTILLVTAGDAPTKVP